MTSSTSGWTTGIPYLNSTEDVYAGGTKYLSGTTGLGIGDGDRVRVETSHGAAEARAWVTSGIRPNTVFLPLGWGERQPFHPWKPSNYLTDGSQRDPFSEQTNLKALLCRITRLEA